MTKFMRLLQSWRGYKEAYNVVAKYIEEEVFSHQFAFEVLQSQIPQYFAVHVQAFILRKARIIFPRDQI